MNPNACRHGTRLLAAIALLAIPAHAEPPKTPSFEQAAASWPFHGGSLSNTRYSTLDQINAANIKTLGGAWTVDLGAESAKGPPVVADGMMFLAADGGHLMALDPATGKTIWSILPPGPGIDAQSRAGGGRR
jgi:glucose dehydrogenase